VFAAHLALVSNKILMDQEHDGLPVILRAKQFINEHYSEDISLGRLAKFVNVSSFYFCKLFKKVTGLNFTEYVANVRIEKARNLLLNLNLRINEAAFAVGFQSITHFNRVFKEIVGESPAQYRNRLPAG